MLSFLCRVSPVKALLSALAGAVCDWGMRDLGVAQAPAELFPPGVWRGNRTNSHPKYAG